jgi:nucleotide-binding universal stress UspA family protein
MKTLVVPVDFSAASLNAVDYAFDFAKAINGSVTVIHVCQVPVPFSEVSAPPYTLTELIQDAEIRLRDIKEELAKKTGDNNIKVYTEVKEGDIISEIEASCKLLKPFAIVMGASGAGAMERLMFGSNTLSAARHFSWPLIIVPKEARFKSISKIGLACDLLNVTQSLHIDEIKKMVNEFNARLHVLHVIAKKQGVPGDEEIEESEWLKEMLEDVKPTFHFMNNSNIDDAIDEFSVSNQLDLLIIIPKKHGLIDRLISKSHTKQLILHTHVPLMSIHE